MPNELRGEIEAPGVGVLRFDWNAIAKLKDAFGAEWDAVVTNAAVNKDLEIIAEVLEIGTGKPAAEIMKASPPIAPVVTAIFDALNLAFNGSTEAPKATAENPPKPESQSSVSSLSQDDQLSGVA